MGIYPNSRKRSLHRDILPLFACATEFPDLADVVTSVEKIDDIATREADLFYQADGFRELLSLDGSPNAGDRGRVRAGGDWYLHIDSL